MKLQSAVALTIALVLSGCATVSYQPYEGSNNIHAGRGGTKVVSNGIDFWANGEPNRRYKILGVASSEVGSGIGDEDLIRAAVSREVQRRGGDAAIEMANSNRFSGVVQLSPTLYGAANTKQIKYAVIKYMD